LYERNLEKYANELNNVLGIIHNRRLQFDSLYSFNLMYFFVLKKDI